MWRLGQKSENYCGRKSGKWKINFIAPKEAAFIVLVLSVL